MERIDELTGNKYGRELEMYMRYHGLSLEQAAMLLETQTYKERDALFLKLTSF